MIDFMSCFSREWRGLARLMVQLSATIMLVEMTACGAAETVISAADQPASLRVVNAVTNAGFEVAGSAIDLLIDGDTTATVAGVNVGMASSFRLIAAGPHTFKSRVSGDVRMNGPENLFRFVSRASLIGTQQYTLLVMGYVPPEGLSGPGAVLPGLIAEDRFGPGSLPDGTRAARVTLINAALFSTSGGSVGGNVLLFLTSGDLSAPASLTTTAPRATVAVRSQGIADVTPGRYVITATNSTATRVILAQTPVTLVAGQTASFVLTSNGTAPGVPSAANHRLNAVPAPERTP